MGNAAENGLGKKPFMGWSSWSLEATTFPGYGVGWLTEAHVKAQSDAMHEKLQKFGYNRVNIDSGWHDKLYDAYGRPLPDPAKFPDGIAGTAAYVHKNGQLLGIYYNPGIQDELYNLNPPILGTSAHIRDIVFQPKRPATGWRSNYRIDFSNPAAQAYVNSVASLFASWGIDFLKFDGVCPGSDITDISVDARQDVKAWADALAKTRRPIWFELSWDLDEDYAEYWRQYANGWRVTGDVEAYGPLLTRWGSIWSRFDAARHWLPDCGPDKGWNDYDSLDMGVGAMDGLSDAERKTMMTFWAMGCAPLYAGDDLAKLDDMGIKLLTNPDVVAIDQAGVPATVAQWGVQQVWFTRCRDGSTVVALFNTDDKSSATVTANLKDLGLLGTYHGRDLWTGTEMPAVSISLSANLASHDCELVRLVPIFPRP
jgi:hypothetical protein